MSGEARHLSDLTAGALLFLGLVLFLAGSFVLTLRLPRQETVASVPTPGDMQEIAGRMRVFERRIGGKEVFSVTRLSTRLVAHAEGVQDIYDLVAKDVKLVLPHEPTAMEKARQKELKREGKKDVSPEALRPQDFLREMMQTLPEFAHCRIYGLSVSRSDALSNVTPWFTARQAEASLGGMTVYDCVEVVGGQTNFYAKAVFSTKPFRLER